MLRYHLLKTREEYQRIRKYTIFPCHQLKWKFPKQQLSPSSPSNDGCQISVIDQVRKWGVKFDKGQDKEPFKEYVLVMQNLMRHANLSEDQKLERIFRNSQPKYQWYIRRKDLQSLPALLELANELESISKNTQLNLGDPPRHPDASFTVVRITGLPQTYGLTKRVQQIIIQTFNDDRITKHLCNVKIIV